jgi:hypothetical protein
MKKTVEQFFCDVCKKEASTISVNYPVIFHTDQTEGRGCAPYISQEKLDICTECGKRLLILDGWGAQGCNKYEVKQDV